MPTKKDERAGKQAQELSDMAEKTTKRVHQATVSYLQKTFGATVTWLILDQVRRWEERKLDA